MADELIDGKFYCDGKSYIIKKVRCIDAPPENLKDCSNLFVLQTFQVENDGCGDNTAIYDTPPVAPDVVSKIPANGKIQGKTKDIFLLHKKRGRGRPKKDDEEISRTTRWRRNKQLSLGL